MTLEIDPTSPLRRPADLRRLVEAIVAAKPEDEQDWLEWKSTLDLNAKEGHFKLARPILGLANRDPLRANRTVQGLGYIVVGASPGEIVGVDDIDTARLDDALSSFLGDEGPQWSAHRVDIDGKTVLVIIVEPPAAGDDIHPLCASFQGRKGGSNDGTIFVRSGTKSHPATAAEIRMLVRRARDGSQADASGPPVDVVVEQEDVRTLDEVAVRHLIAEGLKVHATKLLEDARRDGGRRRSPIVGPIQRETRNLEEFQNEVNGWVEEASEEVWKHLLHGITESDIGALVLRVRNLSAHNVGDVEVRFALPRPVVACIFDHHGAEEAVAPDDPETFGDRFLVAPLISTPRFDYDEIEPIGLLRYGVRVEEADNDIHITVAVGPLRPNGEVRSEPAFVILTPSAAAPIDLCWTATALDISGVAEGTFTIQAKGAIDPAAAARLALTLLDGD